MITIQTQSDGVLFNFQDSTRYLYGDGSILTPYNSLTLIADESNVLTFRKSASNDIFITAGYDELGYSSKEEAINDLKTKLFKATGGSESGITSGDVETMIDAALADYYTDDEVDAALSGKADASDVTEEISAAVSGKADTTAVTAVNNALTAHTSDSDMHVTQADKTSWNAKLDASAYTPTDLSNYYTSAQTEAAIEAATSGKVATNDFNTYTAATATALSGKQDALEYYSEDTSGKTANIHIEDTENSTQGDISVYGDGTQMTGSRNDSDEGIDYSTNINVAPDTIDITYEKSTGDDTTGAHSYLYLNENNISLEVYSNEVTTTLEVNDNGVAVNNEAVATEPYVDAATSGKADTSAVTALDSILTAHTSDTGIHVSAQEKNAWNAKAEPYSAGTGIEISGNVISATGGGGATYNAGTNISIDTANTINCTLPITAGTYGALSIGTSSAKATRSFAGGEGCVVDMTCSNGFSFGLANTVSADAGTAFGFKTNASVYGSFACGKWNDMANAGTGENFGSSGNTVFAVGNGWKQNDWTSGNATKHNALDIRQNGDIYFPDTDNTTYANFYQKPMVRLQDMYGALGNKLETSAITSAITSASTNAEVAGAKAVYDAIQAGGGGGGSVTVDSYLDTDSTNPVENQVIAQEFNDLSEVVQTKADQSELYELLGGSNDEMNPVGPIRLLRISQFDYDDLANGDGYDPDTLYIITP